MKALQRLGSHQLLPRLLFRFRHRNRQVLRVCRTRLVLCGGHWGIEVFSLTTMQSSNQSHDEWLASLFSSGLPSPELPIDFLLAIRRVLTSPYPTPLSLMLDLSAWSIDLGQASLELMFLSSLCRVRRLQLTHALASQAVVQMANLGLDPIQAAEFHVADMLQQSRLLSSADSPQHTPHPASRPINFCVKAVGLPNRADTSFD